MNLNKVAFTLVVSLLISFLFVTGASASSLNDEYIMVVNIDEQTFSVADHSDSVTEGNWISLCGGTSFSIPYPLTFTYNGVNYSEAIINGRDVNVSLNVDNFTDHVITYPYATHRMYTNVSGSNNVEIDFSGSDYFANKNVDVYLVESAIPDAKQILQDMLGGDTSGLNEMLNSESVALDSNGDMSMDYYALDAGSYCVLIVLADDVTSENVLLSATAFEVLDYDSDVTVSSQPENITLNIQLECAPDITYTYGAILVKESEYKAELRVDFDGTRDGFDSFVNDLLVVDGFDLVGMDLSDMGKGNAHDLLIDIYGSDNISIACDTVSFNNASLLIDTTSLSSGEYILFTGVMSDYDMVAFDEKRGSVSNGQFQVNAEVVNPPSKKKSSGGGGGSSASSGESYENVILKNVLSMYAYKDKNVECSFIDDQNPIKFVRFTPLLNAGSMKSVVEVLKETSGLVSDEPFGLVYKNVNIAVGSGWANERTVKDAIVGFAVEKEWLASNNVDVADVRLLHYTTEWVELETNQVSEDDDFVYFIAKTSNFSPFAIVGISDEVETFEDDVEDISETLSEDMPVEIIYGDEPELDDPARSTDGKIIGKVILALIFLILSIGLIVINERKKNE